MTLRSYWQKWAYTAAIPLFNPLKKIILGDEPNTLLKKIEVSKEWSKVLIVGGGNDGLLKQILNTSRVDRIDYLDISSSSIHLSKKTVRDHRVNFIRADFTSFDSDQRYDAIIFPFFLDMFYDPEILTMIYSSRKLLEDNGFLIIIDFENSGSRKHMLLIRILYLLSIPLNLRMRWKIPDFNTLAKLGGFDRVGKVLSEQRHYSISAFTILKSKPEQNAIQWTPPATSTKKGSLAFVTEEL